MKVNEERARELAKTITKHQRDEHIVWPSGREWTVDAFGFAVELNDLGKLAMQMAKGEAA